MIIADTAIGYVARRGCREVTAWRRGDAAGPFVRAYFNIGVVEADHETEGAGLTTAASTVKAWGEPSFHKSLDDRFHESCHKRGIHLGFRTPI
jgi:hypothetical protein